MLEAMRAWNLVSAGCLSSNCIFQGAQVPWGGVPGSGSRCGLRICSPEPQPRLLLTHGGRLRHRGCDCACDVCGPSVEAVVRLW